MDKNNYIDAKIADDSTLSFIYCDFFERISLLKPSSSDLEIKIDFFNSFHKLTDSDIQGKYLKEIKSMLKKHDNNVKQILHTASVLCELEFINCHKDLEATLQEIKN